MDTAFWTLAGGISVFSNRVAEAVKAFIKAYWTEPIDPVELKKYGMVVSLVALLVSIVAGVVGAMLLNLNFFLLLPANPYTANLSSFVGVLITGALASTGSELIQWVSDLLGATRDRIQAQNASTSNVKIEAETTVVPKP